MCVVLQLYCDYAVHKLYSALVVTVNLLLDTAVRFSQDIVT